MSQFTLNNPKGRATYKQNFKIHTKLPQIASFPPLQSWGMQPRAPSMLGNCFTIELFPPDKTRSMDSNFSWKQMWNHCYLLWLISYWKVIQIPLYWYPPNPNIYPILVALQPLCIRMSFHPSWANAPDPATGTQSTTKAQGKFVGQVCSQGSQVVSHGIWVR